MPPAEYIPKVTMDKCSRCSQLRPSCQGLCAECETALLLTAKIDPHFAGLSALVYAIRAGKRIVAVLTSPHQEAYDSIIFRKKSA